MIERTRAHLHIEGQVQGVFFRQETLRLARSLQLSGWVRNLPDGRVEAVFEGDESAVNSAIQWCRRGPDLAIVKGVEIGWEPPRNEHGFRIR